ncbi:stretch-activated cation channel mid1 [Malassezia psittaci]|uniref:Stretch-activated cation channel mid1 n=1 Tax=Malassezia psittaci TaxID=1821823 RepID=A0AAF0F926_9BASI|nr:stretch-activated cation channel mid1 [Malassezia psittaci]
MVALRAWLTLLVFLVLISARDCDAAKSTSSSSNQRHASSSKSESPTNTQSSNKIKTQLPTLSTASFVSASTGIASETSGVPVVNAESTPYVLQDSVMVRTDLGMNQTNGLFFMFNTTADTPIYVSLSLCDGPRIPAYNTSNSTLLSELGLNANQARQVTLVSMFVSPKWSIPRPGPDSGLSSSYLGYAQGGWAQVHLPKGSTDGIWIGIYPPLDPRGLDGIYRVQLSASTKAQLEAVASEPGLFYDDSDAESALLTSFNYTSPAPNISLIVLPTEGQYSLSSLTYLNSSFCAILDLWQDLSRSSESIKVNSSETSRNTVNVVTRGDMLKQKKQSSAQPVPSINDTAGLQPPGADYGQGDLDGTKYNIADLIERATSSNASESESGQQDNSPQVRMQFLASGLDPGRNYTAYLVSSQNNSGILSRTLYPSIKFVTKQNPNCRLLYDVPFCPELAYSIPSNPSRSMTYALQVLEDMVSANYGNFSATLGTFPCDSDEFGKYSSVTTCNDCMRAYQSWLCAVAIPRCTDLINTTESAASQDGTDLEGLPMPADTHLYPYVVNRVGPNSSRQRFIDELLAPGDYGELLPCISTCEMVTRSCPPIMNWLCPKWTVTAQRDYGTFADAGTDGLGAGLNGGAGPEGLRYGGAPSRYVAYDSFGHVFCNAMDVDRLLRQASSSSSLRPNLALFLLVSIIPWVLL